ncbi:MAG: ribonuclease III [Kocuria sp.]|uniref:Ribonuclease 3 n=1 Tax=Kocuria salsicia TaxID=664639 RepID=A0ABV3K911_9MICC|nr:MULTISPECIES: ribonuclease III [Kocuria]MBS6029957.1 ribonuclease III [Kocuria rhizophila]MDO4256668.1 ribonuclease III [Kocuria sp.]
MATLPDSGELLERLGVDIDTETLRIALTHRSYAYEHTGELHNERLEFLGDAVLQLAVTDEIYHRYPDWDEGRLAKLRASVVSARALAGVARTLGLGPHIRLGKGEIRTHGSEKASILADTTEAVIGAVYESQGPVPARDLVLRMMVPLLEDTRVLHEGKDWKTQIVELVAQHGLGTVRYEVKGTGPDHERHFTADAVVNGEVLGHGEGTSKKAAERAAAAAACETIAARFPSKS